MEQPRGGEEVTVGSGKGGREKRERNGAKWRHDWSKTNGTERRKGTTDVVVGWWNHVSCVLSVYVNQAKGEDEEGRKEGAKTLPPQIMAELMNEWRHDSSEKYFFSLPIVIFALGSWS